MSLTRRIMPTNLTMAVGLLLIVYGSLQARQVGTGKWEAGVAEVIITPEGPLWMAGYAFRSHPSEGKITGLHAKALALEDGGGKRVVLVTMDLVGIPKQLSDKVRDELTSRYDLSRAQVILNTSHTHTGPVLTGALVDIYPIDASEQKKIDAYTDWLGGRIVEVVGQALARLKPAQLYSGSGIARFQVNRRNNQEKSLLSETPLNGPNDYAVPVIKVLDGKGAPVAIVFGYACHNTVLSGYKWSGDYAGFAQLDLEKAYPGAVAMFFQGCGADQNPLPRRTLGLAHQYGQTLAAAVTCVLEGDMKALRPQLATAYGEVQLQLNTPPTEAVLAQKVEKTTGFEKRWATRLLQKLKDGDTLRTSYPFPVEVWKLGDQALIALGGEDVVEYAIELKRMFGQGLFVLGYSNDVMTYIPTPKILREGGYEGATAAMVYGLPATWKPSVSTLIFDEVLKLASEAGLEMPGTEVD